MATSTIFTGITAKAELEDQGGNSDWNASNNAHDNIINLIKSKSTLEQISLHLLAQHLMYGNPNKDNNYISAKHYKELIEIVPSDVMALVDRGSEDRTVENFKKYKTEDSKNFIYGIFNWTHRHYSYIALQGITVRRRESSDMIELSYQSDDSGIALNTLALLNKQLKLRYEDLLLSTSNDVIKYFQERLAESAKKLELSEDELVEFNTENGIINYEEQTKHLAAMKNTFEVSYEQILLANRSSQALMAKLESQMDIRTDLMLENKTFLNTLQEISNLHGKIAEIEVFSVDSLHNNQVDVYKRQLVEAEDRIKKISNNIEIYKYSKQGIAITELVNQWLNEVIRQEKSKAELIVMEKRRQEIQEQYDFYSPVGPNLNRRDRTVRVAEEEYLTLLHHLGLAYLKQKNILLNSGTLQVVTPPELPLLAADRNRELYVLSALIAAILFISGFYMIIEFIDRTLRDRQRTEQLTSGKVLGAYPRGDRMKYRGYSKEIERIATNYMANALHPFFKADSPTIINILSNESGEGKTMLAQNLKEYWENMDFSVKSINYETDFNSVSKQFLKIESIMNMPIMKDSKPEIIIVEYAPLMSNNIPVNLLREASVNLLIANAGRAWKGSDQPLFDKLKDTVEKGHLFIYLTNADRDAVEEFTGQLPPYTKLRKLSYRIFNLGITARG